MYLEVLEKPWWGLLITQSMFSMRMCRANPPKAWGFQTLAKINNFQVKQANKTVAACWRTRRNRTKTLVARSAYQARLPKWKFCLSKNCMIRHYMTEQNQLNGKKEIRKVFVCAYVCVINECKPLGCANQRGTFSTSEQCHWHWRSSVDLGEMSLELSKVLLLHLLTSWGIDFQKC